MHTLNIEQKENINMQQEPFYLTEFEIKYFPAGDWEIQFWHESTGYLLAKIDGKEITEGRKKIAKIKIEDEQTFDLGKIDIDLQQLVK